MQLNYHMSQINLILVVCNDLDCDWVMLAAKRRHSKNNRACAASLFLVFLISVNTWIRLLTLHLTQALVRYMSMQRLSYVGHLQANPKHAVIIILIDTIIDTSHNHSVYFSDTAPLRISSAPMPYLLFCFTCHISPLDVMNLKQGHRIAVPFGMRGARERTEFHFLRFPRKNKSSSYFSHCHMWKDWESHSCGHLGEQGEW